MNQGLLAALAAAALTGVGTALYAYSRAISPYATTAILYTSGAFFSLLLWGFFDGDTSKLSIRRCLPAVGVALSFTFAVYFFNVAVGRMPLASAALLRQLGLAIPIIVSLVILSERPSPRQTLVMFMAIATITVAALPEKKPTPSTAATSQETQK